MEQFSLGQAQIDSFNEMFKRIETVSLMNPEFILILF